MATIIGSTREGDVEISAARARQVGFSSGRAYRINDPNTGFKYYVVQSGSKSATIHESDLTFKSVQERSVVFERPNQEVKVSAPFVPGRTFDTKVASGGFTDMRGATGESFSTQRPSKPPSVPSYYQQPFVQQRAGLEAAPQLNLFERTIADAQQANIEANLKVQTQRKPLTVQEQANFLLATGGGAVAGAASGVAGVIGGGIGAVRTAGYLQRNPRKAGEVASGIIIGTEIALMETGRQLRLGPSFVVGEVGGTLLGGKLIGIVGSKAASFLDSKTAKLSVTQSKGLGQTESLLGEGGLFKSTESGSFKTQVKRTSIFGEKTYTFDTGIRSITLSAPLNEFTGISRTVGVARTVSKSGKTDLGFSLSGVLTKEGVPQGFDFLGMSFGNVFSKKRPLFDVGGKYLSRSIGTTQEAELFGSVGVTALRKSRAKSITDADKSGQVFRTAKPPLNDITDFGLDFGPTKKKTVRKQDQLINQNLNILKPVVKTEALKTVKAQQFTTKVSGKPLASGSLFTKTPSSITTEIQPATTRVSQAVRIFDSPRARADVIQSPFSTTRSKQDLFSFPVSAQRPRQDARVLQTPKAITAPITAQRQAQKTKVANIFARPTTARGYPNLFPPFRVFPASGIFRPQGKERTRLGLKKQKKKSEQLFRYQPSASAVILNIFGKKPKQKIFSGLEFRPLLKRKKKKKKR